MPVVCMHIAFLIKKNGTTKVMHHCSLFINEDAETQKTRRRDVKDVKLDEGGQKVLTLSDKNK